MNNLYHYTSLETLALILKNKTLCFNNLLNVDDIEEAQTEDMGEFGRFVYVSCWTKDKEESIPLWNLYTPDMHGVRIRLPQFPFEKYHYQKGEYFFTENADSYIDYSLIYDENKLTIPASCPELIEVLYTDDPKKLFPQVKTETISGAAEEFLKARDFNDLTNKNIGVKYSFIDLGKYKRENWNFQREWRYRITISPMGMKESNPPSFAKQQEYIRRIEDKTIEPPQSRIFLKLDEKVFEDLEVVFGPKMTEAEKIMAQSILKEYAPKCSYRDSMLKIK